MESEKNLMENGPPTTPPANNGCLQIPNPDPGENPILFPPAEEKKAPATANVLVGDLKPDHGLPHQPRHDGERGITNEPKMEGITEAKIVARPTLEVDLAPLAPSPRHRRAISVDHLVAKVPTNYTSGPIMPTSARSKLSGNAELSRGQVDTAAPFESVKAAVSKFGGIVDWKAHRVQTVERRKFIEQELEKAQEEMPAYKQQCEAAEAAKAQVLKDLDRTKRLIDELKLNLERAHTEEQQAKQDAELTKIRVQEMEQGIADEASFAAKAQLEVARARHVAAVSELNTVHDELDQLRKDYTLLVSEKAAAAKKAEEAVAISKEVERSVENLTIELITLKQSLDSAHSEHLEAEEHRVGAVMAKEQDTVNWEEELRQTENEIERLNTQRDLKKKFDEATLLLHSLKAELAAYMEMETGTGRNKSDRDAVDTHGEIEAAIAAAREELEGVRLEINKTAEGVSALRGESTSLKMELEREKLELLRAQQRGAAAVKAAASLETELDTVVSEIAVVQAKEEEESEKVAELHGKLEKAAGEAKDLKALDQKYREEVERAREEAKWAKAGKLAKESQLRAAQKEIEAAKASERLALAAITALEESESSAAKKTDEEDATVVTLSLEEYYALSKRAHDAEEETNARVAAAVSEVEAAKEAEIESLNKLQEVSREMSNRRNEMEVARQKAEEATQGKLAVEQELRKWRAEHERRRKADQPGTEETMHKQSSPGAHAATKEKEALQEAKSMKKKKRSFFPRVFMFLARRKAQASKVNNILGHKENERE